VYVCTEHLEEAMRIKALKNDEFKTFLAFNIPFFEYSRAIPE